MYETKENFVNCFGGNILW